MYPVVVGVVDNVENSPPTRGKRGVTPVDKLWIIGTMPVDFSTA